MTDTGDTAATPAPDPSADADARTWATICHLSAFVALIGVPFGHILGPLVVWLIKRPQHAFVDDQGKEALNFQISLTLYGIFAAVLIVPVFLGALLFPVAIPGAVLYLLAFLALVIFGIVMVILAAVRANEGTWFRYPLTIRFIR